MLMFKMKHARALVDPFIVSPPGIHTPLVTSTPATIKYKKPGSMIIGDGDDYPV
jgi:hypothetical protein